jgi:hypothetical protein
MELFYFTLIKNNPLFQSGIDEISKRRVLSSAGAILRSGQPRLVFDDAVAAHPVGQDAAPDHDGQGGAGAHPRRLVVNGIKSNVIFFTRSHY